MIATAKLRHLRIAPRKVRLVADLVRGKKVRKAEAVLSFTTKKAAGPMLKLLRQAVANAKDKFQVDEDNLVISKVTVDEGKKLKRYMPRARGRADIVFKKASHVSIVLDEVEKKARKKKAVKKAAKEEPEKAGEKVEEEVKPEIKRQRQKPEPEKAKATKEKGLKRFFRRKAF